MLSRLGVSFSFLPILLRVADTTVSREMYILAKSSLSTYPYKRMSWKKWIWRLPEGAEVASLEYCISPMPSLHWTPALHSGHSVHHWIWCQWVDWLEAAWTPHFPSPVWTGKQTELLKALKATSSIWQYRTKVLVNKTSGTSASANLGTAYTHRHFRSLRRETSSIKVSLKW